MRASEELVRVIIRRPHAYFFIADIFEARGGIRSSVPGGCKLADGSVAPLPGLYVLDPDGRHAASMPLAGASAQRLIDLMSE